MMKKVILTILTMFVGISFYAKEIEIFGEINDLMVRKITKQLSKKVKDDEVLNVSINSPGGSVLAGYAIIDAINRYPAKEKNYYVVGIALSMGAAILANGEKRHRFAGKNSFILVHDVSSGTIGKLDQMKNDIKFTQFLHNKLVKLFVDATGKSVEEVEKAMSYDHWMSVEEAMEFGIVDGIY